MESHGPDNTDHRTSASTIPSFQPNLVGNFYPNIALGLGVISSSIPYCIARNREKYVLENESCAPNVPSAVLREQAWRQTLYCNERVIDQAIPSYILHDAIIEDRNRHQASEKSSEILNSVVKCHHGSQSLFVHTAGAHLDDLVLRNLAYCQPHNKNLEPGFSLSLGQGCVLKDLQVCGTSANGSSSHLLARTNSEIFHVRTMDIMNDAAVDDKLARTKLKLKSGFILDPIKRWSLPTTISSMASSMTTWMHAAILATDFSLLTWTPTRGLLHHNEGNAILPSNFVVRDQSFRPKISSSPHPQLYYLSTGEHLLIKDLRSREHAKPLFRLCSGRIRSMISLSSMINEQGRCLMMSVEDRHSYSCLIDTRCGSKPLITKYLPESHDSLRHLSFSELETSHNRGDSGSSKFHLTW
jgi:hypothetical protein